MLFFIWRSPYFAHGVFAHALGYKLPSRFILAAMFNRRKRRYMPYLSQRLLDEHKRAPNKKQHKRAS